MKFLKFSIALAILTLTAGIGTAGAKNVKVPRMYMYGVAASFNDSIVYFTDISEVDGAWIDSRTDFLQNRDNYSLQLKNYLAEKMNQPNRTCIVVFSEKRGNLEKDYARMKKKYAGKSKNKSAYDVRNVAGSDFRFTAVEPDNAGAPAETGTKQ